MLTKVEFYASTVGQNSMGMIQKPALMRNVVDGGSHITTPFWIHPLQLSNRMTVSHTSCGTRP